MAIPFVLRANPVISGDCHTSGAPRSEFAMEMIAGGNHTIMWCGLVRNDSIIVAILLIIQTPRESKNKSNFLQL